MATTVGEALDARGAGDVPARRRRAAVGAGVTAGVVTEIWLTGAAAAPMRRVPAGLLVAGAGLDGDRYALGGGTWAPVPGPGEAADADRPGRRGRRRRGGRGGAGARRHPAQPRDRGRGPARAGGPVVRRRGRAAVRDEALPAVRAPGTADRREAGQGDAAPRRRSTRRCSPARRSPRGPSSGRSPRRRRPAVGHRSAPTAPSRGRSDSAAGLHDHRDALAPADRDRGEAVAAGTAGQLREEPDGEDRAGGTPRMTERQRPALGADPARDRARARRSRPAPARRRPR